MKQIFIVVSIMFWVITQNYIAHATTYEVCATCKHKSITAAISISSSGDTLIIHGGFYKEGEIIINKPLVIIGKNKPIIDGDSKAGILVKSADSVVINGLIIQNIGVSYTKDYAAIHLSNCKYFTIENNELRNVFFGIMIEKSHVGIINNNKVSSHAVNEFSSGNGVHIWHSDHVTVSHNHVSNLRDGIYFEFVSESKIFNNISIDNLRYGLHFMFSNQNDYYDNQFINNGAGVAVMFSKFITMRRNKFVKNWGSSSFGLLLKEINDAEIVDNIFQENTIGINVEGCSRINYEHNTLISNGWAVKIAGGCYANVFKNNNFTSNSFDVSYNSKMNDNKFDGNYWSSYTGYDLDKNGVGDVPYRPVKLFSYIVNQTPETIILLRSLFIDMLNFSEKVSPVFTPDNLVDATPKMKAIHD